MRKATLAFAVVVFALTGCADLRLDADLPPNKALLALKQQDTLRAQIDSQKPAAPPAIAVCPAPAPPPVPATCEELRDEVINRCGGWPLTQSSGHSVFPDP